MQDQEFITKLRHFNRFNFNLMQRFNKELYGEIFTVLESDIVTEIDERGTVTANQLVQSIGIDKGQLSNILKRLEAKGVVIRLPNPADKRSSLLKLTAHGKELHAAQGAVVNAGLAKEVSRFSASEKERLARLMNQYERAYRQDQQVTVRRASAADLGFITDLHSRVYDKMNFTLAVQHYFFKYVGEYAKDGMNGVTWIAEVDGERVGTVSLLRDDADTWKVRWVAVDDRFQGLGIGSKLLDTLMDYVHQHQIPYVYLWTIDILKAARHFYGKAGFVKAATKENTAWKAEPITEEKWEYRAE